jgi:hypothetical protein
MATLAPQAGAENSEETLSGAINMSATSAKSTTPIKHLLTLFARFYSLQPFMSTGRFPYLFHD